MAEMRSLPQGITGELLAQYIPSNTSLGAGAAGSPGTDTNPVIIFRGLQTNIIIHKMTTPDSTYKIYDQLTGKRVAELTIASSTNADFDKLTLFDIIKKTTATFDATHPVDIAYSAGAKIDSDTPISGGILFTAVGRGCC